MSPDIYIAGIGIVSPLGNGAVETCLSLQKGCSGLKPLSLFPVKQHPPLPVGQVEFAESDSFPLPRTHRLAIMAAEQAMSGWRQGLDAVLVGTTTGGISRTEKLLAADNSEADSYAYHGLGTVANEIGRKFKCGGEILTFSTACSSGAAAISCGCRMLESGRASSVLAGGADSLCFLTYYGFHSLQLVDKNGSRPFDSGRNGMSVAEGAAFLLLSIKKPKKVYGVVGGYGLSCDAYHAAAPHPEGSGAESAMKGAMARAGVPGDAVGYINLHGTGTRENDLAESKAIRRMFPNPPHLSSIKGLSGHGLAASGAIEAVVSVLCLNNGFLPANYGLDEADPQCGIKPLLSPLSSQISTILSNSFGFGGNNASLVIMDKETEGIKENDLDVPLSIIGKSCITGAGHTLDSLGSFFTLNAMAGILATKEVARDLPVRSVRRMKRFSQMSLALAETAKKDYGIQQSPHAVFMGSGWGALSETYDFLDNLRNTDEQFPSPIDFVGSVHNSGAGHIAIRHGATGPNITCSGGDSSFEQALLAADLLLGDEVRHNTAFVMAADEFHARLSPLLDQSVSADGVAADGGGCLYVCRKAIPGKVAVALRYQGRSGNDDHEALIAALGGIEKINARCGMILAGIPAAYGRRGEVMLDRFMKITDMDVPVIHYRRFTGEFASASAVAAVMATQLIESGEIMNGKSVFVLGFADNCTAMEFYMQS